HAGRDETDRNTGARSDPDPVEVVHRSQCSNAPFCPVVTWGRKAKVHDRDPVLPTLVFFFSETSGPARRMESLLAHIERKERGRLRLRHVDAAGRPRLVKK